MQKIFLLMSRYKNASSLVDSYLHPHVISLFSYMKDTIDLLRTIEGISLPLGTWLVALDIESMYNSIPQNKGIEVVQNQSERGPSSCKYNEFVLELLNYILRHNVFLFDSSHYLQVQGVAMGAKCAPSYANMYLNGWEKDVFSRDDLAHPSEKVVSWHRYIFWSGSESELYEFLRLISINDFNLRFTMEHSQTRINFLDLTISIDVNGKLDSSLYRKPSAGNTILHANSSHPDALLRSIPYSQYLQLKRNCSKDLDFQIAAKDLYERLLAQGYSHACLKRAYNRVNAQRRDSLIFSSKPPKKVDTIRIITRYSNQHNEIRKILNRFWPLLSADPVTRKYIKEFPAITFRRVPSLKDRLVHSHFSKVFSSNNPTSTGTSHVDTAMSVLLWTTNLDFCFLMGNGTLSNLKLLVKHQVSSI